MTYPFNINEEELFRFEEILKSNGLSIESNSDLENISLDIIKCNKILRKEIEVDNSDDIRLFLSRVAGLVDFIHKILKHEEHSDFNQIIPHLQLLNDARSVPLTTLSGVTDSANNKLFELYVALLVMDFGTNLELESPEVSKGDNPDILFDYNGERWGIACKAIHSKNEKTLFDTIEKGTKQINRSEADKGFVFVNFKNVLDYDSIWPITNSEEYANGAFPEFACFDSIELPLKALENVRRDFEERLKATYGNNPLEHLPNKGKTTDAFLIFLHSVTSVRHNGICPPTLIKTIGLTSFKPIQEPFLSVAELLNQAMHNRI